MKNLRDELAAFKQRYEWRMLPKVNPSLYEQLVNATAFLGDSGLKPTISQRVWHVINDGKPVPSCGCCGRTVKWDNTTASYRQFCSVKCHNMYAGEGRRCTVDSILSRWASLTVDQQRTVRIADSTLYADLLATTSDYSPEMKVAQRIWLLQRGGVVPTCSHCNNGTPPWNPSKGQYEKWCSLGCAAQAEETTQKKRRANITRYGVPFFNQINLSSATMVRLQDPDWLTQEHVVHKKTLTEIAELLGCDPTTVSNYLKRHGIAARRFAVSKQEREMYQWLIEQQVEVIQNDRNVLDGRELDLYLPQHNIAIEMCGMYWHSDRIKPINYHKEKMDACSQRGIRLFTIFDDEWQHRRNHVLRKIHIAIFGDVSERIGARQCTTTVVPYSNAVREFFDAHHIQGFVRASTYVQICDRENVAIGYAAFDVKGSTGELKRMATSVPVTGGLSKVCAMFAKHHSVSEIITFADLRYDTGAVYTRNGFDLIGVTPPTYYYGRYTPAPIRYHRSLFQRKFLSRRLSHFDPNLTEFENCDREPNLHRVWDCGKLKFVKRVHHSGQ